MTASTAAASKHSSVQDDGEEGGFHVAPTKHHHAPHHRPNQKRVYIGNLPKTYASDQNTTDELEQALQVWLEEQSTIEGLEVEVHSIEINTRGKNPHALVDCGPQANLVIRTLHQRTWQGQILVFQREKRNPKQNKNPNHVVRDRKNRIIIPEKKPGFGGGWSAPKRVVVRAAPTTPFTPISIDQATMDIEETVQEGFASGGDDPINTALASTAAASLLAAMNAFSTDGDALGGGDQEATTTTTTEPTNWEMEHPSSGMGTTSDEPSTFHMKPMVDLMADFGQADPNWKKIQVDSVAEAPEEPTTSQLAQKGKAPIHVNFSSFGFSKGAPKRMDGWTHRQPLLPLDCRAYPAVPGYLQWQDGLSGRVKRAFQYMKADEDDEKNNNLGTMRDYARKTVANQVWDALRDAQDTGGHGYASPLEMTIYIGSEAGRHRSVVVCEWAATQTRKFLRQNANNAMNQPVSVGTSHRDVDAHRQNRYKEKNKQDPASSQGKKKSNDFAGDW